MKSFFDKNFYAGNRRKLITKLDNPELIVIPANSKLQKNADESFPFRQDSSFWYLTGLDIADAILVIDVTHKNEYIVLPYRHAHRDQWESAISPKMATDISGIDNILGQKDGIKLLKSLLVNISSVHALFAPSKRFQNVYGFTPNPSRSLWLKRLRRMNPAVQILNSRNAIKELRIIKQDSELNAIKHAIKITEESLSDVRVELPSLRYEFEVRAVLHAGFQRRGGSLAFDTVVASGPNAALLHYEKITGTVSPDHMLLIDAGAAIEYYAADITRIFKPASGMNKRQQEVYQAVEQACEYASSLIKPGIKHREYEKLVRNFVGEQLIKLGLINRITHTGVHRYFPSMTSHHLGLDVHDIANYDEEFQPGMVMTIEPGIYIPEEGIGVRIEDDVLVTKSGIEFLSEKLPVLGYN